MASKINVTYLRQMSNSTVQGSNQEKQGKSVCLGCKWIRRKNERKWLCSLGNSSEWKSELKSK